MIYNISLQWETNSANTYYLLLVGFSKTHLFLISLISFMNKDKMMTKLKKIEQNDKF